jgi:hypothetical protein
VETIPSRVKTFLWLALTKSMPARDTLLNRGGECAESCIFRGQNESIDHFFFICPLAKCNWNVISYATRFRCQFTDGESVSKCVIGRFW